MKGIERLVALTVCAAAAAAPSDASANHCAAQWQPAAERITRAARRFDESIDRRDRIMGCRQVDIVIDGYRFWESLPKHCVHQNTALTPTSQLIAKWERIKANNCRPDQLARAREEARQRGATASPGRKAPAAGRQPRPQNPLDCISITPAGSSGNWRLTRYALANCRVAVYVEVCGCYQKWAGGCQAETLRLSPTNEVETVRSWLRASKLLNASYDRRPAASGQCNPGG